MDLFPWNVYKIKEYQFKKIWKLSVQNTQTIDYFIENPLFVVLKRNFFRIIVADDSKAMRLLLKQIIDQNNITPYVEEAEDGTVVMKKLSKFKPDLVILDLKMPKMDGLDTIKEIKKLEPTTEILVISSSAAKYDTMDAIEFGATDYIVKPFDRNLVAFRIVKILREKANREQSKNEFDQIKKLISKPKVDDKEISTIPKNYLRRN